MYILRNITGSIMCIGLGHHGDAIHAFIAVDAIIGSPPCWQNVRQVVPAVVKKGPTKEVSSTTQVI